MDAPILSGRGILHDNSIGSSDRTCLKTAKYSSISKRMKTIKIATPGLPVLSAMRPLIDSSL